MEKDLDYFAFPFVLQSIFLVFSVLLIAFRFGFAECTNLLHGIEASRRLAHLVAIPVSCCIPVAMILYNQRSRLRDREALIRKLEVRRSQIWI